MDGQQQRRALTAAERSIRLALAGDIEGAQRAASTAERLDQIGAYGGLADLVGGLPTPMSDAGLATLTEALGPGPLAALAEALAAESS